jgi:hypothetical protein
VDSKRGYFGPGGKVIKEYGLPTSIFDDSNVEESVNEEDLKTLNLTYGEDKETKKKTYDYSGFIYVPQDLAIVTKEYDRTDLEDETEGPQPDDSFENEPTSDRSALTDITQDAVKDNKQNFLECKLG